MLLSRNELIATLFRETDRSQRLKTGLTLILCGIVDWKIGDQRCQKANCTRRSKRLRSGSYISYGATIRSDVWTMESTDWFCPDATVSMRLGWLNA